MTAKIGRKTDSTAPPAAEPPTSWTFGRFIRTITLEVAKSAIGMLFFSSAQAVSSISICRGKLCYFSSIEPGAPLARRFTPGVSTYMNVGLQLVLNATHACPLQENPFTPSHCGSTISNTLRKFEELNLPVLSMRDQKQFIEKGIALPALIDSQEYNIHLYLNPEKLLRYKDASYYLEHVVLNAEKPFQGGVEETLTIIKNTHYLLTHDLPSLQDETPGHFREKNIIIQRNNPDPLTEKDIEIYKKLAKYDENQELSAEERTAIHKMVYEPPKKEEIEPRMRQFAEELAKKLKSCTDYVEVASFIHQELVKIHPFNPGLGRLARLLMNTILALGGHPEVIFKDAKEYLLALEDGIKDQKVFTAYLKQQLKWTKKHQSTLFNSLI